MEQAVTARRDDLDIAKGLGIIAVVLGHSGAPYVQFFSLYHMALFFFISGYFYKDSYSVHPLSLVRNRIRTLYLPFIGYGLFFGLLHNVLYRINVYSTSVQSEYNQVFYFATGREFLVNLVKILSFAKVEQIIAALWFLPVLFLVNMLFGAVAAGTHRLARSGRELLLGAGITVLFLAGFFYYPDKNQVLRPVSIAMVVTVMFYFGYLWKRHEARVPFNPYYAAVCFLVLLACYPFGPIDTGGHLFVSPWFYLVSSLSGIYLNLFVSRRLAGTSLVKQVLALAGRNTIAIMALHFVAFRLVNYLQVRIHDLPSPMTATHPILLKTGAWWIVYTLAGIVLPVLFALALDRVKAFVRQPAPVRPL